MIYTHGNEQVRLLERNKDVAICETLQEPITRITCGFDDIKLPDGYAEAQGMYNTRKSAEYEEQLGSYNALQNMGMGFNRHPPIFKYTHGI